MLQKNCVINESPLIQQQTLDVKRFGAVHCR